MYFSWAPADSTTRGDFFRLYHKAFLESLDPSNTELDTATISFYPGFQLIRAKLAPQTVSRDAAVSPPKTILVDKPHVAFLLYKPAEVVIPTFPQHSRLEKTNTLLRLNLNQDNVIEYIAFYFSIVFRNVRYLIAHMDDLSGNGLTEYQKGLIAGIIYPFARLDRGLLVFNIEIHKYPLAGTVYDLTTATIRDSRLAISKLRVSDSGFITVDSKPIDALPAITPPPIPNEYYCPEYSRLHWPRRRRSLSALANNWISITIFVISLVLLWRYETNITSSSRFSFALDFLFAGSAISLMLYLWNSLLYQYRAFLSDKVPPAVTENWRGHDTMLYEWLAKRVGAWLAGSLFIFAQMGSLTFLWTFACLWLQDRWMLLSTSNETPTIDSAFSFAVVSLLTGLFTPLTDVVPMFDQALVAPFSELTLWGKIVRTLIGVFFAVTAAKTWRVLISKWQSDRS